AASAAAVTGPSSGSVPGFGASAAGWSPTRGRLWSAAWSSNPGVRMQAIIRTHVLHEQVFACQGFLLRRADRDLVVHDALVEAAEDPARRVRDDRGLVVVAGERADPVQRLPEGEHGEVDAIVGIAAEHVAVHVALDAAQIWKRIASEV